MAKNRKNKTPKELALSKSRAAGMAAATKGKARAFASKKDILPKIQEADAKEEIERGLSRSEEE